MNTDLILINGDIVDRKEGLIEYCDRGHQFGEKYLPFIWWKNWLSFMKR